MKLHFFKEDALNYFEANIKSNIAHYAEPTNQWVYDQYEEPFIELDLDIEPFDLLIDLDNPTKMDLENIKIFYSALKNLTDSQACDERLWAGLAHGDFYNYAHERWNSSREKDNMKKENIIRSRYFFSDDSRSKLRHTIAKLWWLGKLLYDSENEENPFHLIDVLGRKDTATRINDVFTSNFSRNIHLLRPFMNAIDYFELSGTILNQDYFRSLVQYMNIIGGIYLIDALDEEVIKFKLINKVRDYNEYGPDVVKGIKKKKINKDSEIRVYSKNKGGKFKMRINEKNIDYFLGKKQNDIVMYEGDELKILLIY